MGRESDDIDIVIGASPLNIGHDFAAVLNGKFIPLDEANDIARVALYDEAPLHIDLAKMRGSITEDLALRDFTIDAMAVSLHDIPNLNSSIIDPFGGRKDIKSRLVRSISEDSFKQDPARLLRAVRLAAEFGFTLDAETLAQIKRNHMLIAQISAERVRDELCRIIAAPKAVEWLRLLDELGLLMVIFTELADTRDAEQPKEHYWDVLQHSFETVAAIEYLLHIEGSQYFSDDILSLSPWSPALKEYFEEEIAGGRQRRMLLKLVGLLHDIAKPQTRMFEESGGG
jgi:poly(A) polymerase